VMSTTTDDQAATGALSTDIEALLCTLVSKLKIGAGGQGSLSTNATSHDNILLDVEIADVRFLVMRQGCPSPMSLLSPREQEIARMVAQGYANKTIASVLEISTWTVASHLRRIYVKLQVSSRAAMATSLLGPASADLASPRDEGLSDLAERSLTHGWKR
jgi:DNA-binding CsgD family transcriptional regulator